MSSWISSELLQSFAVEKTTAHRLCTTHDAWVERFGSDALISFKTESARDLALAGLRDWESHSGFQCQRVFARFLPKKNAERVSPLLLAGDPALPLETVVTERGVCYGIDFAAGYSAGLFIDQRVNRAFVRQLAPKRMLNTFAYTCSFSVVAAMAGAKTLSLDLSKKSLERGKNNFQLNGLSLDDHRFLADDVLNALPRLERKREKFDLIILDPPTFSLGAGGRRWRVEDQLVELLQSALELAAPGAFILLSSNCSTLDRKALEQIARHGLKLTRRSGELRQLPSLPDFPPGEGAQTFWLAVK